MFSHYWNEIAQEIHATAVEKGWWNVPKDALLLQKIIDKAGTKKQRSEAQEALSRLALRNQGEIIALIHSELSEALEALREGNRPDDKLPQYSGVTVELADVVIRIMDYAGAFNLPVAEALEAKVHFNRSRPPMHGGKKF